MQAKEFREFDTEELKEKLYDFKRELFNLRMQKVTGEIQNFKRINEVKKNISRILTIMNERNDKKEGAVIENE